MKECMWFVMKGLASGGNNPRKNLITCENFVIVLYGITVTRINATCKKLIIFIEYMHLLIHILNI